MFGKMVSDLMVKPGQAPVFDSPANYGLPYEDVTFTTEDGVRLSGWLVGNSTDRVIVQSHFGVQCSRCGFTQQGKGLMKNALWTSDIKFLEHAKPIVDAGYSLLMYDMRNHGESEQKGYVSWGQLERKDLLAAVQFVTSHPRLSRANIGLLSICMGQGATTFAYGLEPALREIEAVKALISVQPLTYDEFVKAMGLPGFQVNAGNKYNAKHRDLDLTGASFMPHVEAISVPTMVIQNRNDSMTNLGLVEKYFDSLKVEKELVWLEIEKKRGATYAWMADHTSELLRWFNKYL